MLRKDYVPNTVEESLSATDGDTLSTPRTCSANDENDRLLIRLARRGDKQAEQLLFTKYRNLIGSCTKNQRLPDNRQDMTECLWIVLAQAIRGFNLNGNVPFAGYVKCCIQYGAKQIQDRMRRIWKTEMLIIDVDRQSDAVVETAWQREIQEGRRSTADMPPDALIARENNDCLRDCLHCLDEEEQQLITALFFEARTVAQVAAEYGITPRTVYRRRERCLEKLRNTLLRDDIRAA